MSFSGIPVAALDFYEDLEADNSKVFWQAHKAAYDEHVKAPMQALVSELEKEFGPAKLFRPYRDVRFSKDKTPYKTHQGAWFDESSVYVHVGAPGLFLAAGYWRTEPDQLARLRRAVDDDVLGAELVRAVAAVGKGGWSVGGDTMTRVPAGYEKDHPRADLLRHRTLVVSRELGCPDWLSTPKARGEIARAWRRAAPLTDWLHTHVGPSERRTVD